jgi:hypothetical protein
LGGTVYLVSAGGRAQLKIWSLTRASGAEEEELMAKELDSFMLLGSDKAVRRPWKATASGMRPDPETRFLCIAAVKEFPDGQLRIFVGCSDAALRIFTYNLAAKLVLVSELAWQEHCILQVRHFTLLKEEEEEVDCLLVTTTGGRIYGLLVLLMSEQNDQGGQPRVGSSLPAHQSGINAVDVRTVAGAQSGLVLSGGDDNSLLLTRVNLTAQRMLHFVPLWRHSAAHAAQITGVKLLGKEEYDYLFHICVNNIVLLVLIYV